MPIPVPIFWGFVVKTEVLQVLIFESFGGLFKGSLRLHLAPCQKANRRAFCLKFIEFFFILSVDKRDDQSSKETATLSCLYAIMSGITL